MDNLQESVVPSPEVVDEVRRTVTNGLKRAQHHLKQAQKALNKLEDMNDAVPIAQAAWIDQDLASPLKESAEHISDLAVSIQRRL